MSITLNALKPYFTKNEYGSGENICQDFTINDGYELYIDGKFFNRYEVNTEGSWNLISDYEQEEITLVDEDEEIEGAHLEFVTRTDVFGGETSILDIAREMARFIVEFEYGSFYYDVCRENPKYEAEEQDEVVKRALEDEEVNHIFKTAYHFLKNS